MHKLTVILIMEGPQFKSISKNSDIYYDSKPERKTVQTVWFPYNGKYIRILGRIWKKVNKKGYLE